MLAYRQNKVAHLTSVHTRYDTRIFIKMCKSLAKKGYDVSLVVADGNGSENLDGVSILDVGKPSGRLNRILKTPREIYKRAIHLNADIYHLHDPELMPIGLKLIRQGKIVIFDAHEDFPKQITSKPYLNMVMKFVLSNAVVLYESRQSKKFSTIIGATSSIAAKFSKLGCKTAVINNYPILGELSIDEVSEVDSEVDYFAYVGGISEVRGIEEMVHAVNYSDESTRLLLVGEFSTKDLYSKVSNMRGWDKVLYKGFQDRRGVSNALSSAKAGMVTLLETPNHIESQPIKMFEYMSVGLPVISSNFPLWREIVEGNNCGVCVDPNSPNEIADAMKFILENPQIAKEMGVNGRRAVLSAYNWEAEEFKLFELYKGFM